MLGVPAKLRNEETHAGEGTCAWCCVRVGMLKVCPRVHRERCRGGVRVEVHVRGCMLSHPHHFAATRMARSFRSFGDSPSSLSMYVGLKCSLVNTWKWRVGWATIALTRVYAPMSRCLT